MRVLGIETSCRRGSVALVEAGTPIASAAHEQPNAHAEQILPLIERLMAESGWSRSSLDRIGVGVGPGAFTGIRVGIALGQGIGLGTGRPVFGVASLEAMARAVPAELPGARCPVLDARRDEVFVAAYAADGSLRSAPRAVRREAAAEAIASLAAAPRVVVGEVVTELAGVTASVRSEVTDLPHALWTARIAAERPSELAAAEPLYVRDAGAALPDLPPSPFGISERGR